MLTFKQYISLLEGLNKNQKAAVQSWFGPEKIDYGPEHGTASKNAVELSKHIIPEGQNHIIIPAVPKVMKDVETHLNNNGFDMVDYTKGIAKNRTNGQSIGIGKVLSRTGADPKLINDFANDDRESTSKFHDHHILISREANDIASCSTDKPWTSCAEMEKNGTLDNVGAKLLPNEIKQGTHVAYLIPKEYAHLSREQQIDRAVSRVSLKPFSDASGHKVIIPDDATYSKPGTIDDEERKNVSLLKTLTEFTDKHFPMKEGVVYKKHPSVYDDDRQPIKFNTSENSINTLMGDENNYEDLAKCHKLQKQHLSTLTDHFIENGSSAGLVNLAKNKSIKGTNIDRLIGTTDAATHKALLLYNKNLSESQLNDIIGKYTGQENPDKEMLGFMGNHSKLGIEGAKALLGENLESVNNIITSNNKLTPKTVNDLIDHFSNYVSNKNFEKQIRLISLARHKNLDEGAIDKLLDYGHKGIYHDLAQYNADKLSDDQASRIISQHQKWYNRDNPSKEDVKSLTSLASSKSVKGLNIDSLLRFNNDDIDEELADQNPNLEKRHIKSLFDRVPSHLFPSMFRFGHLMDDDQIDQVVKGNDPYYEKPDIGILEMNKKTKRLKKRHFDLLMDKYYGNSEMEDRIKEASERDLEK